VNQPMQFAAALTVLLALATPADAGHRGWRHGHGHWEHHHRGGGGGFVGGFLGGIVGGMIAGSQVQPPPYDPVADCMRRFRSYNPETGIYYGYDGRPRRCP
jgi:hypothetical protein